jgi:peroxiredoxin
MNYLEFQDKLAQIKKRVEGNLPPRFLEIMHRSTRDLVTSGIESQIVQPGEQVPDFTLPDERSFAVSVHEFLQKGPLIITFYRGFWCSYCNADLFHINSFIPEITELGAQLIGVSPELPLYSQKIMRMQKLDFHILTDHGNQVAEKFRVKYQMAEDLKQLYKDSFSINLKLYHGDEDWTLPIPARFLIDTDGIIRYSEASADYTMRPDPEEFMKVLKSMRSEV